MNKNYIIWGISNKGYEDSISSSYPNNVIPPEFKASVSDSNRKYAFAFAKENQNGHYFYSIEQVGSNVLYTIYRTNFKGGSTGNRLAYDAATIIISKNHIIEKPLISLKLLISSYIKQKDSGFGNFNFENALAGIRLLANNDKRSISKRYKAGYIKYHSETELSSVLVDKKDKLHNFNKVYFFTRLSLLEQGENKIQDLKDYKATPIKIIHYDARYYRVFVENNEVTPFDNTVKAYEGDEIKIYNKSTNKLQADKIAKAGEIIKLKKIEPPKPKPQLTNQYIRRKRKSKEKITKYVVFALCSVMILVISGFMLEDNIKGWLRYPSSKSQKTTKKGPQASDSTVHHKVVFDGKDFIKKEGDNSYNITNADSLFHFFKESIYFKDDIASYTLYLGDDDWKISTDKDVSLKVDDLKELKEKIKKANQLAFTNNIVSHINKVIDYEELIGEKGLAWELDERIWQINVNYLMFRKSDSNTEFAEYTGRINNKLETFLRDNLPADKCEVIMSNQTEFKNKEKGNEPVKKQVKQQIEKPVCRLTKEHKDNAYWHSTRKKLESLQKKDKDKADLDVIVKQESATIDSYKLCGCPKCKTALKDPHLEAYIKEFLENYEK